MKNMYCMLFILSTMLCSMCKNEPTQISPLSPFEEIDTSESTIDKSEYYLVENYNSDSLDFGYIKRFAIQRLKQSDDKFSSLNMFFYKSSNRLNKNFVQNQSDLLLWHGDDLIYSFKWIHGKFGFYTQNLNGKILHTFYSLN